LWWHIEIVKFLLELESEDINCVALPEHQRTPLHKAMILGSPDMVSLLLEAGADPTIKDSTGKTPYQLGKNQTIQKSIRFYAAEHRDQWDWAKAVVVPLTPEEDEQKRLKEAEKRKKKNQEKKAVKKNKQQEQEQAEKQKIEAAKQQSEREEQEQPTTILKVVGVCAVVAVLGCILYFGTKEQTKKP